MDELNLPWNTYIADLLIYIYIIEFKPWKWRKYKHYNGLKCLEIELDENCRRQNQAIFDHKKFQKGLEVELDLKVKTARGKARRFYFIKSSQNGLECLEVELHENC